MGGSAGIVEVTEMTNAYIYNMAWNELMRMISEEEKKLGEYNMQERPVTFARLEKLKAEEKELHAMILKTELNQEVEG